MTTQPARFNLAVERSEHFWSNALIATMLGCFIGSVNLEILTALLTPFLSTSATVIVGGLSGLIAGAIQGAFLRHRARPKLLWLAASCAGWLAAVSIAATMPYNWLGDWLGQWFGGNALRAAIIGTAQWLVLRREWPHALWWIPLNIGVWTAFTLFLLVLFAPFIGFATW